MTVQESTACRLLPLAALLAATVGSAQTDPALAARLVTAARQSEPGALAALLAPPAPLRPLVDALLADRELTRWYRWRAFMMLADARRDEVAALWHAAPDERGARIELFAGMRSSFLLERHVRGDARERRDAETLAPFLSPGNRWSKAMRNYANGDSPWLRSAETLQRAAARAARTKANAAIARLRQTSGTPEELANVRLFGSDADAIGAFELAELLTDADRVVRTRAMAALRDSLHLPRPAWLQRALADDPAPQLRPPPEAEVIDDASIGTWLALLAGGDTAAKMRFCSRVNNAAALSPANRERLAKALFAVGQRAPFDAAPAAPGQQLRIALTSPGDELAVSCFGAAARLGAKERAAVLALAVAATGDQSPQGARLSLRALAAVCEPVLEEEIPGLAALVLGLLDHPDPGHADPQVVYMAAHLAERLLARAPTDTDATVTALRQRVDVLALQALKAEATTLSVLPAFSGCGTGPQPIGPPASASAAIVLAAAASHDMSILKPLLDELTRLLALVPAVPALGRQPDPMHHVFVLRCLDLLAPHAGAGQARALHALLAPRLVTGPWGSESRDLRLIADIVHVIYPVVPPDLLPWYEKLFGDRNQRFACTIALDAADVAVPAARALALLRPLGMIGSSGVYLYAPELLLDAWRAGGVNRSEAVRVLSQAMLQRPRRVVELVRQGVLPREFAVSALPSGALDRLQLQDLVELLPGPDAKDAGEQTADWTSMFAYAVRRAAASSADADLRALAALAASPVPAVAVAAARRAAALGAAGRALALDALDRMLAATALDQVVSAARAAVEDGLEAPALRSALPRLRGSPEWVARMLADAVELRFFGLDPLQTQSGYPAEAIKLARRDVDLDTLRKALAGRLPTELQGLYGCAPGTWANAVQLAAEVPVWSEQLERCVLAATTDADARVRRAAYLALKSRDAELWECAWLVPEAAFDPDPAVRTLAR